MAPFLSADLVARDVQSHKTRVPLVLGVAIGLCVLSSTIGALRIAVRSKRRALSWEDGFIVVAIIFSILESAVACLAAHNGYGDPVATLAPDQKSSALMWFWWAQVTYKLTIWPTKLSILFLYRRVFGDTPNVTAFGVNFRAAVYWLMGFCAVFCVITLIVNILTCIPINHYWNKAIPGSCNVDPYSWWLSQSVLNTLSDLLILLLPMPLVKNLLQVPVRQKVGLCFVFSLGFFVVIVTIVRITTFKSGGLGDDLTYDGAVTLSWSLVESNVAIVCACLPLLRPFIARLIPGFCGRSTVRNSSYPMAQRNTDDVPTSKPRNIHVPGKMRPRSWAGIETTIEHGSKKTSAAGIHKQMDVEMITESASVCGTDSLRRLTESRSRSSVDITEKMSK